MKDIFIEKIGIDTDGRLYIKPKNATFPFIYREAMEVNWNSKNNTLYSPPPRDWTYLDWYQQIIRAAKKQSGNLIMTDGTCWENVPAKIQEELMKIGLR